MKKLVFFSILFGIILGFLTPIFLYTAHASNIPITFPSISITDGSLIRVSSAPALGTSGYCDLFYEGTYPDISTPIKADSTGCRTIWDGGQGWHMDSVSHFLLSGLGLSFPNYPYGSINVANKNIWVIFAPATLGTYISAQQIYDNAVYYAQLKSDENSFFTLQFAPPTSGIQSQTMPYNNSSTSTPVLFSGTYNNIEAYMQICATFTTSDMSIAPFCSNLPLINGFNLPYSFNVSLPLNHLYSYQLYLTGGLGNTALTTARLFSIGDLTIPPVVTPVYEPQACTWSDMGTWGGCISNLFYDLLFPSSASLQQFNTLYMTYRTKPPFGYINAIQTSLTTVNDTATATFTLTSLPILNTYIFNPLRIAFAWILWLGFAFVLFKRFKDIQL